MKYKGKEIKTHLRENVIHVDAKKQYILPSLFASINYLDHKLRLGDMSISLGKLQTIYGADISKNALIEKGKDYLVNSVLDRYTVTQRAEPGVKAMYCKAHIADSFISNCGVSGTPMANLPKDTDIFIPIFTCVSIPRHSVIYTSGNESKRRASAGKITNILWCPTRTLTRCIIVPKNGLFYNDPVCIDAELIFDETNDKQADMIVRNLPRPRGFCFSRSLVLHIEFDDYNPKTKTTDTVYSMFEMQGYLGHINHIKAVIDYTYLARHIGYSVKIDDFDITPTTCSTGFHFFDSIDEAKDYISV